MARVAAARGARIESADRQAHFTMSIDKPEFAILGAGALGSILGGHLARAGTLDMASLKRAALAGTVMASFAVEAFGTERLQGLGDAELRGRMDAFAEMLRVG